MRSTACSTRSRVKVSFSSPMTTAVGSPVVERHQIAAAHLALDLEAELFEEALDRQVEA